MAGFQPPHALQALWWPLRSAWANAWPRRGDAQMQRMRRAAGGGEGDMHADAAERMYGALYLSHIRALAGGRSGLRILDVGCQSGRLAVPLAAEGHKVTALDLSPDWLALCRRHALEQGVALRTVEGAAEDAAALLAAQRFDLVICTELLYALEDPCRTLRVLRGLLDDRGLLVTSHRTRHYMLLTLARFQRWDDLAVVAGAEEGRVLGGQHYGWHEADTLHRMYARCGLQIEQMHGIGCLSGVGVDGLAGVLDAATLREDLPRLQALEQAVAHRYPDAARYRLVIAHPV